MNKFIFLRCCLNYGWLAVFVCVFGVMCWTSLAYGEPGIYDFASNLGDVKAFPVLKPEFSNPRFPVLPQADYDTLFESSDKPVPEPGTFLLILPGMALLGYKQWRKKRHGGEEETVKVVPIPLPSQHIQPERLALVGRKTNEVVHDIKNALTGMRTCAEVMGYEELSSEERQELTSLMVRDIDRMTAIAEELLEFSRGNHHGLHIHSHPVNDVFRALLTQVASLALEHHVSIQTDLQYIGNFQADFDKMQRVLLNLITNALDAMPDGGNLTIRSGVNEHDVQFEISDTGCGMTPECQINLFEPFFTEGKPHGTGLGMVIVKDIIEAHKGQIEVQSEVSTGTTIRISLPL